MADKKRAITKAGKFIADDPNTPENEAFTTRKKKRKKNG